MSEDFIPRPDRIVLKPRHQQSALKGGPEFREALAGWFSANARDYPWRRTRDPYAILVSEVMLQQTQIPTVLGRGYFTRFLEVFPDVAALAVAEDAPLLKAWEGLGYYRRARMLRETARALMAGHGGVFPQDLPALLKLPGIGPYTAGALRAFAFGLPAVLVDGNISRVLARIMDFSGPVDATEGSKKIWAWAERLADPLRPEIHHAAMMELGQRICRPGVPDCQACPVARFCKTRKPEQLPLKSRKAVITAVDEHALWLRDAAGRVLLHHESGRRRTGLWKLPLRGSKECSQLPVIAVETYAITRYRVTLSVHDGRGNAAVPAPGDHWVAVGELDQLAMAAPFRRVLVRLLEDF